MKIVEQIRCEHGGTKYVLDDGSERYTCAVCIGMTSVSSEYESNIGRARFVNMSAEYAKLLGYLACNCRIIASLSNLHTSDFRQHYFENTELDINENSDGYEVYKSTPGHAPFIYALRMQFCIPKSGGITEDSFYFTRSMRDAKANDGGPNKLLSDNGWLWGLLSMGFTLGTHHNIDTIVGNIPESFEDDFLIGMDII